MSLNTRKLPPSRFRKLRAAVSGAALIVAGAAISVACLDRPVQEVEPNTSNIFVDQIFQTGVDKIDLLFMVDNSISMADKQQILQDAVPVLVERLINPVCVNSADASDTQPSPGATADCPEGYAKEFDPITDIHIGVLSSSLGGHGGTICSQNWELFVADQADNAHLIPSIRMGLAGTGGQAFLAWDPENERGGETDPNALVSQFQDHIVGTGQSGCGFESSLEAWYRFLIEPNPWQTVDGPPNQTVSTPTGVDQVVLEQRAAFLRPDSLVAIIMLSDENDCSVRDDGFSYLVMEQQGMLRATSACAEDPNSPCCRPCASTATPEGCGSVDQDAECQKGARYNISQGSSEAVLDQFNFRCVDQKRRFGIDLLYPIERYVRGLTQTTVITRDPETNEAVEAPNPLMVGGGSPRDPSLIFLAGIVGVPWQDIATDETLDDPAALEYLTAPEITSRGIWSQILGDPSTNTPPSDPFMVETNLERSGTNPRTGIALVNSDSNNPQANPINGHEYKIPNQDDLQYACIFPLGESKDCTTAEDCDCLAEDSGLGLAANRPLCNPPGGGAPTTTQHFAKAYPGLRHLHVLRDFGDNSIVASICPKVTTSANPQGDPNYGYNPAVSAIISRLKEVLGGRCLPRELVPDEETNQVPCAMIEAVGAEQAANCADLVGRADVNEKVDAAVRQQLAETGLCGGNTSIPCSSYKLCEILQHEGDKLNACQNDASFSDPGYCYIDPGKDIGDPSFVEACPATEKRILRFVGDDVPRSGSVTFIACVGASFNE